MKSEYILSENSATPSSEMYFLCSLVLDLSPFSVFAPLIRVATMVG